MSFLDAEIKRLQAQKLKVEFYKHIKGLVEGIKEPKFADVSKEIIDNVSAFIDSHIDMIETGEIDTVEQVKRVFNEDEINNLKSLSSEFSLINALITRAKSRQNLVSEDKTNPAPKLSSEKPVTNIETPDKIKFALQNRHLADKTVMVTTRDGEVKAKVQGIDAPYIIVKTETGHTAQVSLDNIRLIS